MYAFTTTTRMNPSIPISSTSNTMKPMRINPTKIFSLSLVVAVVLIVEFAAVIEFDESADVTVDSLTTQGAHSPFPVLLHHSGKGHSN